MGFCRKSARARSSAMSLAKRSTFRDWVAEQTTYQRELAEAALAHVLSDKTEAAYQRGDMLEKRAELMQAWGNFTVRPNSEVVPLNA